QAQNRINQRIAGIVCKTESNRCNNAANDAEPNRLWSPINRHGNALQAFLNGYMAIIENGNDSKKEGQQHSQGCKTTHAILVPAKDRRKLFRESSTTVSEECSTS